MYILDKVFTVLSTRRNTDSQLLMSAYRQKMYWGMFSACMFSFILVTHVLVYQTNILSFKKYIEIRDSFGICHILEILTCTTSMSLKKGLRRSRTSLGLSFPTRLYSHTTRYIRHFPMVQKNLLTIFCIHNILNEQFPSYCVSSHMVV